MREVQFSGVKKVTVHDDVEKTLFTETSNFPQLNVDIAMLLFPVFL